MDRNKTQLLRNCCGGARLAKTQLSPGYMYVVHTRPVAVALRRGVWGRVGENGELRQLRWLRGWWVGENGGFGAFLGWVARVV